jgi:hypothetical protein
MKAMDERIELKEDLIKLRRKVEVIAQKKTNDDEDHAMWLENLGSSIDNTIDNLNNFKIKGENTMSEENFDVVWDWKEDIPWDQINTFLKDYGVKIVEVDTESDVLAVNIRDTVNEETEEEVADKFLGLKEDEDDEEQLEKLGFIDDDNPGAYFAIVETEDFFECYFSLDEEEVRLQERSCLDHAYHKSISGAKDKAELRRNTFLKWGAEEILIFSKKHLETMREIEEANQKIPAELQKFKDMIAEVIDERETDEGGFLVYLNPGFIAKNNPTLVSIDEECHYIRKSTLEDCAAAFDNVVECDCEFCQEV